MPTTNELSGAGLAPSPRPPLYFYNNCFLLLVVGIPKDPPSIHRQRPHLIITTVITITMITIMTIITIIKIITIISTIATIGIITITTIITLLTIIAVVTVMTIMTMMTPIAFQLPCFFAA